MSSSPLATGSRLEPRLRHRRWRLSIPTRKPGLRPLKGGEAELLEQLGERRKTPRDTGLSSHGPLTRPRWF
jgi:hypothetical protein